MVARVLSHPVFHFAFIAMVAFGLALCIFPHRFPSLSWVSNYAVLMMLMYLVVGMAFLFLRQPRLTFISFAGCALLILYLKFSIKNNDIQRWRETVIQRRAPLLEESEGKFYPPFKIAHFNTSNAMDVASTIAAMRESEADILSIHEVTPQWDEWLRDSLKNTYPYYHSIVDIGLFGMEIFSKYEFEKIDTFYYRKIPGLRGSLTVNGEKLLFISVHTEPALNEASSGRLREHLASLAEQVKYAELPVVVFGDFNAVSWSDEIKAFCYNAGLLESRTGFIPFASGGMTSLFDLPLDHIFYSLQLQCTGFENIRSRKNAKRLGISGTYRFKSAPRHAKKTAQ